MCDKNAKRYRGGEYCRPNPFAHAADFFGHTRCGALTFFAAKLLEGCYDMDRDLINECLYPHHR